MKHFIIVALAIFASCFIYDKFTSKSIHDVKIIYIQPIGDVERKNIDIVKNTIQSFYNVKCIVKPNIIFTNDLYAKDKSKYDVKKILNKVETKNHTIVITNKNIVKSNIINEYVVYGSAKKYGKISIVSTYMMKEMYKNNIDFSNQLKKTSLHEIGHTFRLDHCDEHNCIMYPSKNSPKPINVKKLKICAFCKKKLKI